MEPNTLEGIARILVVFFGGSIVLSPVLALSLRHALKPLTEILLRLRTEPEQERRIHLLEGELQQVQNEMHRLLEAEEFRRQLRSGTPQRSDPKETTEIPPAPGAR